MKKSYAALLIALVLLGVASMIFINLKQKAAIRSIVDEEPEIEGVLAISERAVPEGAFRYDFENAEVSYVAKKRLIGKDIEDVTAIGTGGSGYGWFDPGNKAVYVDVDIDLGSISSGSDSRDKDVLSMLSSNKAEFVVDMEGADWLETDVRFNETIPGQLTFNGITKQVNFDVTGMVTENDFTAEGFSEILLTDFGITPPSLVNVADIDNELTVKFKVTGSRSN